jgi:predicted CoA-substrate-specific enzyme activase
MYFAGVDIGSTMTKVVITNGNTLTSIIGPTGAEHRRLAHQVIQAALIKAKLLFTEINFVVATGYGRINVPFADRQITEISCHAKGVRALFPSARTVIDIGGQDSKGIKLTPEGKIAGFVMNDKCASGTGRFLEVIAEALGIKLEEMGNLSLEASTKVRISNTCTVFAELEVVSRLADGIPIQDIIAGLHDAIAGRIVHLVTGLKIEKDVVISGGGAKNIGLIKALEEKLSLPVLVPPEPLITGALGAALFGKELMAKGESPQAERHLKEVTFFEKESK